MANGVQLIRRIYEGFDVRRGHRRRPVHAVNTKRSMRGERRLRIVLVIGAILIGAAVAIWGLGRAGRGEDLSALQRRVVALGRLLPVLVAALGSAGFAPLSLVRRRRWRLVGPGMAFISAALRRADQHHTTAAKAS